MLVIEEEYRVNRKQYFLCITLKYVRRLITYGFDVKSVIWIDQLTHLSVR